MISGSWDIGKAKKENESLPICSYYCKEKDVGVWLGYSFGPAQCCDVLHVKNPNLSTCKSKDRCGWKSWKDFG